MWTHVYVCEGPYHPLRFGRRGCCFYKSENTESDWYTASPCGLVDLKLPHSSDRRNHIPLSVSVTVVYPPQVVLSCTPTLRTYCCDSERTRTQRSPKARSQTAFTQVTTRSQTNHSRMDVLPAHLYRDSFRDSLKG